MAIPDQPNFALSDVIAEVAEPITYHLNNTLDGGIANLPISGENKLYSIYLSEDGTHLYGGQAAGNIAQFSLSVPFDLTTLVFVQEIDFGGSALVYSISLSRDGRTILYMEDYQLHQASLSTAWDISTNTYVGFHDFVESTISIVRMSSNGLHGNYKNGVTVYGFDLATPWDVSTVSTPVAGGGMTSLQEINYSVDGATVFLTVLGVTSKHFTTAPWSPEFGDEIGTATPVSGSDDFIVHASGLAITLEFNRIEKYDWADPSAVITTSLSEAFTAADLTKFDDEYKGNLDRLSNFRNYGAVPPAPCRDVNNMTHITNRNMDGTGQDTVGMRWSWDGLTSLYTKQEGTFRVQQWSEPWDIHALISNSSDETFGTSCDVKASYISRDGRFYWTSNNCNDGNGLRGRKFNTPWSSSGHTGLTGTSSGFFGGTITGIIFSEDLDGSPYTDGRRAWLMKWTVEIQEYSLSTSHDFSTATLVATHPLEPGGNVWGICWNENGTHLYGLNSDSDTVVDWEATTPYDVSTLTRVAESAPGALIQDYWSIDIVIGRAEFRMEEPGGDHDYASYGAHCVAPGDMEVSKEYFIDNATLWSSGDYRATYMSTDGTKLYMLLHDGFIQQYTMSTPYLIDTATFDYTHSLANFGTSETNAIWSSPDGLTWFVLVDLDGNVGSEVFQFTVTTAWDLNTRTTTTIYNIGSWFPTGMQFNADGTKMFILDRHVPEVVTFDLASSWNLAGMSQASSTAVIGSANVSWMSWVNDGKELWIRRDDGANTAAYICPVPYEVTGMYYFAGGPTGSGFKWGGFNVKSRNSVTILVSPVQINEYTYVNAI